MKNWTDIQNSLRSLVTGPLLWLVAAVVFAQKSAPTAYQLYPYVIVLGDQQPTPEITDQQFFDLAGRVVFPVNRSELPADAPLLRQLTQEVIPQLNCDSLQIERILFRGAASPEGPYSLNKQLGEERMKSLLNFFQQNMTTPVAADVLSANSDIEDYRSLALLMRRAGDPDYQQVQDLCDEHLPLHEPAVLKMRLQSLDGGRLWQRLKATYFAQLRTARIILLVRRTAPVELAVIAPTTVVETPAAAITDTVAAPPTPLPQPADIAAALLQRRELLSIKTNLLLDVAYMPGYNRWCPIPNVAVEYYPKHGHFTFGGSFDMPWWQHYDAHKYFQVRNYQLETRYYLTYKPYRSYRPHESYKSYKAPAYSGFYLQGYAHVGIFGICFDADRGWVGEGAGAGVGCGYVMPLSKNGHWRLELGVQAGYFSCKYDPYQYENPVDPTYTDHLYYYKWSQEPDLFKKRQYRFNWFGPTRIGITMSYDLLYRRIQKRGASLKSTERRATL